MNTMKKLLLLVTSAFSLLMVAVPLTAGAQQPPTLPETAGTYKVPGHSKLALRVIVHYAHTNPNKPGPPSAPVLTCGLTDTNSSTVDGLAGWHLASGSWTYHLNTASAPSLIGGTGLTTLAANAFGAWSSTDVGSSVNFVRGSNTSTTRAQFDGQNIISWGRTSGSALAVTYTWYNTSNGQVAENDTIFNSNFAWEWSSQSGCAYQNYYDAQDILTHELGHWMGLDDNYAGSFSNNTMYGYGSPTEVKKDTLAQGDISAVNSLY